jgi:nucleoside-diphosphate-sugar epimerase
MTSVVTGAFGYIGRYIARRLLELGEEVRTITTHPNKPNPFGHSVKAFAYRFQEPDELTSSLHGASTLYNTYWVRFEYGRATFRQAVQNTITLFDCAKKAGIERIVHVSVTHASDETDLPYYKGNYSFALLVWSISRVWRVWLIFGNALISLAFAEIPMEK